MATQYSVAEEVREIALELIPQYHSHLEEFGVRIEYVFSDKTPMRKGKQTWGVCRKVTSLNAFLSQEKNEEMAETKPFFVLVISKPIWDTLQENKRKALVDHELSHAGAELDENGELKLHIIPHDLEEFSAIVRRHGMWREDVKEFVDAAKEEK